MKHESCNNYVHAGTRENINEEFYLKILEESYLVQNVNKRRQPMKLTVKSKN